MKKKKKMTFKEIWKKISLLKIRCQFFYAGNVGMALDQE